LDRRDDDAFFELVKMTTIEAHQPIGSDLELKFSKDFNRSPAVTSTLKQVKKPRG